MFNLVMDLNRSSVKKQGVIIDTIKTAMSKKSKTFVDDRLEYVDKHNQSSFSENDMRHLEAYPRNLSYAMIHCSVKFVQYHCDHSRKLSSIQTVHVPCRKSSLNGPTRCSKKYAKSTTVFVVGVAILLLAQGKFI